MRISDWSSDVCSSDLELSGRVEVVGEVPRTAEPNDVLAPVEAAFAAKYSPEYGFHPDGRHAWLRLRPDKVVSWDFTKIPTPGARPHSRITLFSPPTTHSFHSQARATKPRQEARRLGKEGLGNMR